MDLVGLSIKQLQNLIATKKLSEQEVFCFFSQRIEKYQSDFNAVITSLPYKENSCQGNLKHIPVAVKDNFLTQGVRTTAASKILDQYKPSYNATVINKILQSGALLNSKTNLDAWMHGSSTETSDYGPTCNPWDKTRAPGGSSGGSAVAVAAGLAPVALGTETAGSIRQPASWCGVVGMKPTYGLISRYGIVAMASSMDCPGPMANYVEDVALMLEVMAGADLYDATTVNQSHTNYLAGLNKANKFVIGLPESYLEGVQAEIVQAVEDALKNLEQLGHKIKRVRLLEPEYSTAVYAIIQRSEVASNLARYTGVRYGGGRELFAAEGKRRIMTGVYALSSGYSDKIYQKAAQVRQLVIEDYQKIFNEVDLLLTPATPTTALKLGDYKAYAMFGEMMDRMNESSPVAGLPGISLPYGLDNQNLPIGLQIIGNYWQEGKILNLAKQIEDIVAFKRLKLK